MALGAVIEMDGWQEEEGIGKGGPYFLTKLEGESRKDSRFKEVKRRKEWGERGSNSRPQDHSTSYETYALANCATTPLMTDSGHFNLCSMYLEIIKI
ncbi:hypothetical protein COLO4_33878 [Corchorus olitorius]|uniref:Uncharacterized protein n=1 Tax=Corchorus olitorius TaxID=93759 RepID=A0A1R3GQG3_9ROSI|nr:hypothetical protein COLO4_33878 [Corchorus olitorius]